MGKLLTIIYKYILLVFFPLVVLIDLSFSPVPVTFARALSDCWDAWKAIGD